MLRVLGSEVEAEERRFLPGGRHELRRAVGVAACCGSAVWVLMDGDGCLSIWFLGRSLFCWVHLEKLEGLHESIYCAFGPSYPASFLQYLNTNRSFLLDDSTLKPRGPCVYVSAAFILWQYTKDHHPRLCITSSALRTFRNLWLRLQIRGPACFIRGGDGRDRGGYSCLTKSVV